MDQALQFLTAAQNPDGGWGYQAGGASFTEPTALGLMAAADGGAAAAAQAATGWLLAGQHRDGGWGALRADSESGWHSAVAAWGLSEARKAGVVAGDLDSALARATGWLLANRSRSLPLPNPATKLQGSLAGWSWTPGTFGWVIPTGLALLALADAGGEADQARAQASGLLDDRRCTAGGWNWGNPVLFGAELPPYATETALAILGLLAAGREANSLEVRQGLDWLAANLDPDTGVSATAWALLALRAGGRQLPAAAGRLRDLQAADGGWRSSPHATALSYLALRP